MLNDMKYMFDVKYLLFQAFNRCENPHYIKPDSTPVFSIVRDLGLFSGVILSAPLKTRFEKPHSTSASTSHNKKNVFFFRFTNKSHWLIKSSVAVITIIAYHAAISIVPHNRGVLTYYCYSFFIHLFSVFVLLNYDLIWRTASRRVSFKLKSN